jgi:hypothetical protein
MRRSSKAGLFGILVALGCNEQGVRDETVARQAVVNGNTGSPTNLNQAKVRATIACTNGSLVTGIIGTASFLTNEWLLTAAHVVDGQNGSCTNGTPRADGVTVEFDTQTGPDRPVVDAVIIHPRYKRQGHTDMALLHVDRPFQLNGSTTGYQRPISTLPIAGMLGSLTRCVGYGRSSLTSNDSGTLRFADFTIGRSPDAPETNFGIFKGGGAASSDTGSGIILGEGDSGGGCVKLSGPSGAQEIFGINRSNDIRPRCATDADCPNSGTCDVAAEMCTTNDPRHSNIQAAASFRDFTNAVLGAKSMPVQVDFDGDGIVDNTMIVRSIGGFFFIEFQPAIGLPSLIPTGLPDLPIVSDTIQSFASLNTGDFNNDQISDVLALVGGFAFYFNSDLGAIDLANPFNGQIEVSGTEGFAFSTVKDLNGDGFDDAELVRADGTSRLFFGGPSGLGGATPPPSFGPDFDGDGLEDIAMNAPGATIPPISGGVHILFGNNSVDSWWGDVTAGPDSEDNDFFGRTLAWGNFDEDEPDELLINARHGLRYIDQGGVESTRFIDVEAVTSPPHSVGFGSSMATGDFDGDGFDDVALPAGNVGGRILVLFGAPEGLHDASRQQTFDGVDIDPAFNGVRALAAGDFNCDGRDDLAIGDVGPDHGVTAIVYGSSSGLSPGNNQVWGANDISVGPPAAPGDGFGATLVAGNFNGDEQLGVACHDLAIAATEVDAGGITGAGAVYLIYGSPTGLTDDGSQALEPCCGEPFFEEGNSGFGGAMTISHLNTDHFDDLLVSWPNFTDTRTSEGQVFAYLGGSSGLSVNTFQRWSNPSGAGLAFGWGIGGTSTGLVAVGTPFETGGGHVHVFEANGLSQGASLRYNPNDFLQDGLRIFGRDITGPRPGRIPVRVRERASLSTLASAPQALVAMQVMSFEDPLHAWTSTAPLGFDTTQKTQGAASLVVNASGNVVVNSAPFGTAEVLRVGTKLALDVFVPATQPNPSWLGDVQMSFTTAAANVNNAYIGYAALTGLTRGQWNTIEFTVPGSVRTALLGDHPRARFSVTLNTPGGAQPLRLDNLRFRGELTKRTVHHVTPAKPPAATSPLLGFESLSDWTSPQGGLAQSTTTVANGVAALSIPAGGYREIHSRAFATSELSGVTSALGLSVYIPSNQSNPNWVGDIQAFFSCPSAGLNNVPLGQAILTHLFFDEYNRVRFNLPANVVAALQTSHPDARFSFTLNTAPSSGRYLFDDLGFGAP